MMWLWLRLRGMWEVIHSPETAFRRKLDGPSYLIPLGVLSLLSAGLYIVQSPIHMDWLRSQLTATGAPAAQIASSVDILRRSTQAGTLAVPLLLMLRWLAHAVLIWLTAQLFLLRLDFSRTLTVVAYAYIPILLRDATICLVLCLRDTETLGRPDGLNVALGLNILFPQIPSPWWILMANFNFFEAWFVILLVVGIATLTHLHWQKALAVVLPVWVFVSLIQFGFVSLAHEMKNHLLR